MRRVRLRRSRAARHSNLSLLLLPPFDCLVVDDTSRLARYLPDVLEMNDSLQYHGVFIYAVAQRLDCREKTSRPLLTLHGMMDEQFLVSLGEKVHRGQEGRALNGFQPGGKCYGYRNVPIEDPTRSGKYGRFAISGVKLEIDEEEAAVVRRIFEMYAGGNSQATISKRLNAEGVPAPNPPRTRQVRAWCVSSIFEMLRNERYRGVFVWNRTQKERNRRQVERPADLVRRAIGSGSTFRNGASCRKNSGNVHKLENASPESGSPRVTSEDSIAANGASGISSAVSLSAEFTAPSS